MPKGIKGLEDVGEEAVRVQRPFFDRLMRRVCFALQNGVWMEVQVGVGGDDMYLECVV